MSSSAGPVRRVLMTADTVGGVWTYATDLAAEWARLGIETVIAAMGQPVTASQRVPLASLERVRIEEAGFALEWMPDADADVAASAAWLRGLERRWQPDIVHVNGFAQAAAGFAAPVVAVAHSDVVSWFRAVHGTAAPPAWRAYARRVRAGLDAAGLVVAPTRAVFDDLAASYEWAGPRTRVISNGIALAAVRPAEKDARVVGAGRLWDEAKNLAALDRAAAGLAWPVAIAGDAKHPDGGTVTLRSAEALGVLPRSALLDLLSRAAIFAAPARYEPFGLGILEAAAAGAALVLGDIPSLREIWDDAALFVDPGDDRALAAALTRLIEDASLRRILARHARLRALGHARERAAQRYLAAFETLRRAALLEA
jgi:glycosyltransferase involved in cell wall biosynthesis